MRKTLMSNWKKLKDKIFLSSFFVFFIFLIDRISKILIIKKSEELGNGEIYSSKFMNFELIWNKGIAFGLFSFDSSLIYNLITSLIILINLIIIYLVITSDLLRSFFYVIIFGGSLGNLFDRLYYSAVPDFIDFHYNGFHWFIFNVADIFISLGIICLILIEFKEYIFVKK